MGMHTTFLILGGYGNAGRLIAELLLRETSVSLILAGRNLRQAWRVAEQLNARYPGRRVSAVRVDAADEVSLGKAFPRANLVIVASSTLRHVEKVAHAALEARIDYFDIQLSSPAKLHCLRELEEEMVQEGCCFITDGGFHPGLPGALVRYAGTAFDRFEKVHIGSVIQLNWRELTFSKSTAAEFTEEFKEYRPLAWCDGEWRQLGWRAYRRFDFGSPFGKRFCAPMFLEELRTLPARHPGLRELGFFIAGFNWFVDFVVLPVGILTLRRWPQKATRRIDRLFEWGLKTFGRPPYGSVLLLEATGLKDGKPRRLRLQLSHVDGYMFTTIPVVACLLQYLRGRLRKPGLWFQAHAVDPTSFLSDIERLGVQVEQQIQPARAGAAG